ncbi:MAG: Ig-like domain-containing protein [Bacteroidia bacterium]|nr:Ig-like domain-containing protein [Bacteroidia bacterium]
MDELLRQQLRALFAEGVFVSGKLIVDIPLPGDTVAPLVVQQYPPHNSYNVVLGTLPELLFSEVVKLGTGVIDLYDYQTNLVVRSLDVNNPNHVRLANGGKTVRLMGALLNQSKVYYVRIPNTAILDLADNAFAGYSGFEWVWTTDTPLSQILSPVNNLTEVSLTANIEIRFSEEISPQPRTIEMYRYSDDVLVKTFNVLEATEVSIVDNNRTLRLLNPPIQPGIRYYIVAPGGVALDLQGNPSEPTTKGLWNFTYAAETQVPTVIQYTPLVGSANTATTGAIFSLRYSEAITPGAAGKKITLYKYSDDSQVAQINIETLSLVGNNTIQGNLPNLVGDTQYYFLVEAGFVADLSGNLSAAIANKDTFKFTTSDVCANIIFPSRPEIMKDFQVVSDGLGGFILRWNSLYTLKSLVPNKTLTYAQLAAANIAAGDIISVAGSMNSALSFDNLQGTPDEPIFVLFNSTQQTRQLRFVDCHHVYAYDLRNIGSDSNGIVVEACHHMVYDRFFVQNAADNGFRVRGSASNPNNHITIRNGEVDGSVNDNVTFHYASADNGSFFFVKKLLSKNASGGGLDVTSGTDFYVEDCVFLNNNEGCTYGHGIFRMQVNGVNMGGDALKVKNSRFVTIANASNGSLSLEIQNGPRASEQDNPISGGKWVDQVDLWNSSLSINNSVAAKIVNLSSDPGKIIA